MILWFTGISGVGKSLIAKFIYKKLKKKIKNIIHIDGDEFRKMFKNDLGYTLKDRNKNAERIINFVHFLNQQDINLIISANLTSQKYRLYCKKNFKKFYEVNISTDIKTLKKRDSKKIYKNKNLKNVVGYGIKNIKNNTAYLKIKNNGSKKKFLNYSKEIIKKINKQLN